MKSFGLFTSVLLSGLFAAAPNSTNYTLKAFDVGGSGNSSSSANYKLNSNAGSQSTPTGSSTNFKNGNGQAEQINSEVPAAPTITNPSSYYDRLQLVVAPGSNPSTTKFVVAISPDNFVSTTNYVKSDNSIGSTLVALDYRTYTGWGSGSGITVVGLQSGTTYTVKVKAMMGNFTETGYGPTASAATTQPSLTFAVSTTLTATPPFLVNFASLTPGNVANGNADAIVAITTNAVSGGKVYLKDSNSGIRSSAAAYTLASATADLAVASRGFGAQITSTSQSSGATMTASAPFNGVAANVGAIATSFQELAGVNAPVTNGSATIRLKAKADVTVPSQPDYVDTLVFVAAMGY